MKKTLRELKAVYQRRGSQRTSRIERVEKDPTSWKIYEIAERFGIDENVDEMYYEGAFYGDRL